MSRCPPTGTAGIHLCFRLDPAARAESERARMGGACSYDLLCLEGLSRALRVFLYPETDKPPQYLAREPVSGPRERLVIKPEVRHFRTLPAVWFTDPQPQPRLIRCARGNADGRDPPVRGRGDLAQCHLRFHQLPELHRPPGKAPPKPVQVRRTSRALPDTGQWPSA